MQDSRKEEHTLSGLLSSLKEITRLAPLGLSWLPVMLLNQMATVLGGTYSGWTRVVSSDPEYSHIGWSRAWSGWIRRLRKTSSRSIPVTPSRTSWTTHSTNTFTCAFSSRITLKEEGFSTRAREKGEVQSTDPGLAGP